MHYLWIRVSCLVLMVWSLSGISYGQTAAKTPATHKQDNGNLVRLFHAMTGSYSSAAQALRDTTYFDIRLQMVPIWTNRTDGYWLYVEQAAASSIQRPYRQRIYQLVTDADGRLRSRIYTLPNPMRFAGLSVEALNRLTPDSLSYRTGCDVLLTEQPDGSFVGSTSANDCPSELRGAAYATSEVRVTATQLLSWDRGYDSNGKQVWGATAGGYVFDKLPPQR